MGIIVWGQGWCRGAEKGMTANRVRLFLVLFLFGIILSCAPVISPELRAKVDPDLTFKEVLQNPDAYKGKLVIWGGEINQVVPQNGTTLVEVLERPLSWREKPKGYVAPQGKFIILFGEFLDFSFFKKGKKITVVGELQGEIPGEKINSLSEKDYRYPIILSKQTHLWKDYSYQYSSSYTPQMYDPLYDPSHGAGILRY